MTTVATKPTLRELDRAHLSALLDVEPGTLHDDTGLLDELGLDSVAMMRLLTWLEDRGVDLSARRSWPATAGEVLSLLEKAWARKIAVRAVDEAPDSTQPAGDPLAPVLATRTFRLMPVLPDDIGALYGLATRPETCFRWRYRGAPPSIDRFAGDMWSQVLVQFTVRTVESNQLAGLVVAYNPGQAMRHVSMGAVFAPDHTGAGAAAQVTALFASYLFHTFPLQKIYLEVPGFNWPLVSSGEGRLFEVEGILRDHDNYGGQSWDQRICAIYPHHRALLTSSPS